MNRVKFHTINQIDADITTFILSCNRLNELDRTINSFISTNSRPDKLNDQKTKIVILDDSNEPGIFETLVERYGKFSDVICFPRNRGQWWALDFMVSYCDSDYIFYLEDDWEFIKSGYLTKSKQILDKHRDIGIVDISLRNFEWQGMDCYHRKLIDDEFYYKKPWRITNNHLCWQGWVGSPNLKRRDDLIMLGRVEKWHNEWNIDRRFHALGFKSIFLKDQYVTHLGDHCSRMADKRPNGGTVPIDYYPKEVLVNRTYPIHDYWNEDKEFSKKFEESKFKDNDVTLVTMLLNIDREKIDNRNFENHYLSGLSRLLDTRHPIIIFADAKHHSRIRDMRKDLPIELYHYTTHNLEIQNYFESIQKIISNEEWINQSPWMKSSIITSKYYIPLTLMKPRLLNSIMLNNIFLSSHFYWVDCGMMKSYNIPFTFGDMDMNRIHRDGLYMMKYPYSNYQEIHGYSKEGYEKICKNIPNYVCRATFFGGEKNQLIPFFNAFELYLQKSLNNGYIGTEESIFTIIAQNHPEIVTPYMLLTGDISHHLHYLRGK